MKISSSLIDIQFLPQKYIQLFNEELITSTFSQSFLTKTSRSFFGFANKSSFVPCYLYPHSKNYQSNKFYRNFHLKMKNLSIRQLHWTLFLYWIDWKEKTKTYLSLINQTQQIHFVNEAASFTSNFKQKLETDQLKWPLLLAWTRRDPQSTLLTSVPIRFSAFERVIRNWR